MCDFYQLGMGLAANNRKHAIKNLNTQRLSNITTNLEIFNAVLIWSLYYANKDPGSFSGLHIHILYVAPCHKKAAILLGFTSFTQTKGSRKNLGKKAESADTYLHFSVGTMRTWIP